MRVLVTLRASTRVLGNSRFFVFAAERKDAPAMCDRLRLRREDDNRNGVVRKEILSKTGGSIFRADGYGQCDLAVFTWGP